MLELATPLNFYEAEAGWAWSAEQQGWDGQAGTNRGRRRQSS